MSNLTPFQHRRLDKDEAGQWIARIDRGLSREEHDALQEWLRDPRRCEILLRLARDWDRMSVVSELADLFPLPEAEGFSWMFLGKAAAILLVTGALAAAVFSWHPLFVYKESRFRAEYSTAIGERRTVDMPDHSRLRLNTNTDLKIDFSDDTRLVTMSRGEAMFEVAKDPRRVFTVRVAGYEFKAVGTAFDIRADSPVGLQLTVTEGRVRVHHIDRRTNASHSSPPTVFMDRSDVVVEANKAFSIADHRKRIAALTPDQVAAATAWQHGAIVFKATPLGEVIDELARYSTERFVIVQPDLAKIPVSGYFEIGDMDSLTTALEENVGIKITRHNGYLLLSRAHKNQ